MYWWSKLNNYYKGRGCISGTVFKAGQATLDLGCDPSLSSQVYPLWIGFYITTTSP